ncbi:protein SSX1-like isoform X1 [Rousettus aegyptiacus]|uniref:protein SSX1-like isoform X1 n=1 Tax=Rousettus aegyptiacus TaxID=9407 RepID=UPI000786DE36|nr:protein SSX1-like isoform X1 [Rousettus aegyptiacus]XP_015989125.1 protein SSX1-like isoform X1 [Rousettus aegyptiacus]XP_015989126.1 protein SSX1-like isoform X1 [Rousettus aegyptiacus]
MNRDNSFAKNPRKDSQKLEGTCEDFKDIRKDLSKEEWEKLGNSQESTCAYLKRNYDTMTGPDECPREASNVQQRTHPKVSISQIWRTTELSADGNMEMPMKPAGEENDLKPLLVTPGSEPAQNQLCPLGEESASVPQNEKMSESSTGETKVWDHGLQEKGCLLVYEDISDTEEDSQF